MDTEIHFSSVAQSLLTLCNPMDCSTPGFPVYHPSHSLLKCMSIESVMPTNHLILYLSLLLPPSIFPSIRESVLPIWWPKYWSFSFSICPSNEYSGLISFRIDWFDLLEVQGTLRSLLQHHSSETAILWCTALFIVQPSTYIHGYGKWLLWFSSVQFISVSQSCLTLCDPMDCSLPGSSVHGIFQARVLEWGAIAFSDPIPWPNFNSLMSALLSGFLIVCFLPQIKTHESRNLILLTTLSKSAHSRCPVNVYWLK